MSGFVRSNYPLTYFGLSASTRDRLQAAVSLSRIAFATPIVDLPVFVSPVTTAGTGITDCATLARLWQPITVFRAPRVAAYHAVPDRAHLLGEQRCVT